MNVLVAYASRHGSTAGIAERVAGGLLAAGLSADALSVDDVLDLAAYDAVVLGAAAHMFHWLKGATHFVKKNRQALEEKPLWQFSSGPLGTDLTDEDGRDVAETSRPKEFDDLVAELHPRGERVFFGDWDPSAPPMGFGERLMRVVPARRMPCPLGLSAIGRRSTPGPAEIARELANVDR